MRYLARRRPLARTLVTCVAALSALAFAAHDGPLVQAEIVYTGASISENFDSLGSTTNVSAFDGTLNVQTAVPGTTGFDATRIAGSSSLAISLIADDGGLNSAGVYSYGATSAADRALGALASGTRTTAFGFTLRNNAPVRIDSITITFSQENWRAPDTQNNTLTAAFGTSATPAITTANYLSSGSMMAVTTLDMTRTFVATAAALNGNDAANQVAKTHTFTTLNLLPGDRFFLRWRDVDNTGSDAGIALDDMTLTFAVTAIPEASAAVCMIAAAGMACLVRGRLRGRQGK